MSSPSNIRRACYYCAQEINSAQSGQPGDEIQYLSLGQMQAGNTPCGNYACPIYIDWNHLARVTSEDPFSAPVSSGIAAGLTDEQARVEPHQALDGPRPLTHDPHGTPYGQLDTTGIRVTPQPEGQLDVRPEQSLSSGASTQAAFSPGGHGAGDIRAQRRAGVHTRNAFTREEVDAIRDWRARGYTWAEMEERMYGRHTRRSIESKWRDSINVRTGRG